MTRVHRPHRKKIGNGDVDLRVLYMQTWTTSLTPISIPDLVAMMAPKHPDFIIKIEQVRKWAEADGWKEARTRFMEQVFQKFAAKAADRMVTLLVHHLEDLEPVAKKLDSEIAKETFKFDGTDPVKVMDLKLKVMNAQAKYAELAMGFMNPIAPPTQQGNPDGQQQPQQAQPATVPEPRSHEEARFVAKALIQLRQAAAGAGADPAPQPVPVRTLPPPPRK